MVHRALGFYKSVEVGINAFGRGSGQFWMDDVVDMPIYRLGDTYPPRGRWTLLRKSSWGGGPPFTEIHPGGGWALLRMRCRHFSLCYLFDLKSVEI